jgi:type III secretion system chaperone SycN
MALLDSTLAEMADSLQLPAFSFNNKGVAALRLGETDLVSIEKRDDGVLLSVARPLPPHRQGLAEKALRLCGKEGGLPFPARVGLTKDNRLVFMVWFDERAFVLSEALRCITALRDAHARVAEM